MILITILGTLNQWTSQNKTGLQVEEDLVEHVTLKRYIVPI